MSLRIMDGLWQVGGSGFTDPSDAAAYLIHFDDEAALVDAGTGKGHAELKKHVIECLPPHVKLKYLLLTHCHFDHVGGAAAARDEFDCRIVAHESDAVYLESGDGEVTAASWYGARLEPLSVDVSLREDETFLALGASGVTAIHWPGHSPGSVVYTARVEGRLVLFGQDVHGPIHASLRSDEAQYQKSLAKIAALDADILLEGHYGIIQPKKEVARFIRSFMRG